MTRQEALDLLKKKQMFTDAYGAALALFHWDATTGGAVPPKSYAARGQAQGFLYGEFFRTFVADDTGEAIQTLEAEIESLSPVERASVKQYARAYRKNKAIPPDEYQAYQALLAESGSVWEKAKKDDDFALIKPYYEKIFDFQRKLCDWYGYKDHPYNALLDDYELGATVGQLDVFFDALRAEIVPLLHRVTESGKQFTPLTGHFDLNAQKELNKKLAALIGYDFERGRFAEAEHPYTTSLNRNDVRITTHFYPELPLSALFSTIHEGGHAIYNQNIDEALDAYGLGDGASMGIHESQSRLYENILGRSRAFAELLLPELQSHFPDTKSWDAERLYGAMNIAKPSLIRVEADELTYCLHIVVRYELEKALLTGACTVADLPELWRVKYRELLGICPENDRTGVLQDTHWGSGLVGYFASYAVGTAYSAQFAAALRKTVDLDAQIRKGDFAPINAWLGEHIHRHGQSKTPDELLRAATGEAFNAKHYTDYLKEKFGALYGC